MTDMREQNETQRAAATGDERALRIMAKSVYRDLKAAGHSRTEVIAFAGSLIALVTDEMRGETDSAS
jgi:hypothetical protein